MLLVYHMYTDPYLPQAVCKGKEKAVIGSMADEAPNFFLGMAMQPTSKSTVDPPSNSSAPNVEIQNHNTPDNNQSSKAGLKDETERLLKVNFLLSLI